MDKEDGGVEREASAKGRQVIINAHIQLEDDQHPEKATKE